MREALLKYGSSLQKYHFAVQGELWAVAFYSRAPELHTLPRSSNPFTPILFVDLLWVNASFEVYDH